MPHRLPHYSLSLVTAMQYYTSDNPGSAFPDIHIKVKKWTQAIHAGDAAASWSNLADSQGYFSSSVTYPLLC